MSDEEKQPVSEAGEQGAEEEKPDEAQAAPEAEEKADAQRPTSLLSEAIAKLQQEKQETWDRLLRTAAEFDNHKKRSKREVVDRAQRAEERVVLEFLPVMDNLERAVAHATEGEEATSGGMVDGVKMVHKQFLNTLEKYDIRPFDSVGEAFDPELHEAVQQMPDEDPPGTVTNELQRGYRRGDRLVRPAVVVVSSGPAEQPATATPEQDQATPAGDAASNPTEDK